MSRIPPKPTFDAEKIIGKMKKELDPEVFLKVVNPLIELNGALLELALADKFDEAIRLGSLAEMCCRESVQFAKDLHAFLNRKEN